MIKNHLLLHWRRYTILERLFVFCPLTLVTPSFIPFITSLTHDGEPTHEFVITMYLLVILTVGLTTRSKICLRLPKLGSLEFFVCCFTLWVACSLLWTSSIGATLGQIVIWVDYAALMLLAKAILRRRSKIGLVSVLMVTAGIMAAIKMLGYVMLNEYPAENSPLFKNVGVETEILVTLLPLFWLVILSARRIHVVIVSLASSILCIMACLSTYQRTPLLALIGAVVIITISVLTGWIRPQAMVRAAFVLLAICLSYSIQINLPSNTKNHSDIRAENNSGAAYLALKIADETVLKSSAYGRFVLWDVALEMLISRPVLGIGAGAYKANYAEYRAKINEHSHLPPQILQATFTPDQSDGAASFFRAHNEVIQILGELGLIGGLILSAMFFRVTYNIFKSRKAVISIAVISGTVAFLISSSFSSFSFRWIPCGFTFFLIATLILPSESDNKVIMRPYYKWVSCIVLFSLIFCLLRSGEVLLSQYFEAKAEMNISDAASDNYKLALDIDPSNFTASFKLGTLYYRTKQSEKAVPLLDFALKMGLSDVTAFQTLALAQSQSGETEKAEATLQKGIKVIPSSIILHVIYAELLRRKGNVTASNAMIHQARKINPEYAEAVEVFWNVGEISKSNHLLIANKLGTLWGAMRVNRSVESSYNQTK